MKPLMDQNQGLHLHLLLSGPDAPFANNAADERLVMGGDLGGLIQIQSPVYPSS